MNMYQNSKISFPESLLRRYPIISQQMTRAELVVLLSELQNVLSTDIEGDVVELGCYEGTSALFEARMLREFAPHKMLWLYDSFEGLPEKTTPDNSPAGLQYKAGELNASKAKLLTHFSRAGLPRPHIKKAWFGDLTPHDLPKSTATVPTPATTNSISASAQSGSSPPQTPA